MVHDIAQDPNAGASAPTDRKPENYKRLLLGERDMPLIEQLSPAHQVVLLASGSYAEMATELGVPVGTLRSRLHRARATLVALRHSAEGARNKH